MSGVPTEMIAQNFITKCVLDTAEGLRDGLCHFSPPSRVALIYAVLAFVGTVALARAIEKGTEP